jgi:hypothetical protein
MDWTQTERNEDVLGTRKDRVDDGLEQREMSEDGLGTEIERSLNGQRTKRKDCRWTGNRQKGL